MPKYYITIPSGRRVSIGEYVRSWKALKTLPPDQYVANWQWFDIKARDILRDIRRGVHDRINQGQPARAAERQGV